MQVESAARQVLETERVAIFIVAYNAEKQIQNVLSRIPSWIAEKVAEVYVIDDHSADETSKTARQFDWPAHYAPIQVYRTPYNQGYGGNQRLGYLYAIQKKFDIVVLLHGDGQYAPEALPEILAPYTNDRADAVFGSRFLKGSKAIRAGMPIYKWIGNRILTALQNKLLHSKMSEMHCGYRSYRVSALKEIPFQFNSLDFDFDSDIIIQLLSAQKKIIEVPVPTYYGKEIQHMSGVSYAWHCLKTTLKFRFMQIELFYDPKFDLKRSSPYTVKHSKNSLHYFIRNLEIPAGKQVLDVGGGDGESASRAHAERGVKVTCIDSRANPTDKTVRQFAVDLDLNWETQLPNDRYDCVFALDVIEHLKIPEKGCEEIFRVLQSGGKLYASTGNVAFLPVRWMLFLGHFNYGRKGILDLTHKRLFTLESFQRMVKNWGFRVDSVQGFGFPISDMAKRETPFIRLLDSLFAKLAKAWPKLFAYQILLTCTRIDSALDLMKQTFRENPHP